MNDVILFLNSVDGISRDLNEWERQKGMTGQLLDLTRIKREWEVFTDLLDIAQERAIDKDPLVCTKANDCVGAFIKIAPNFALSARN